ncbi:hypothetical protein FA13DRAFT_297941 [Coprinellus micaceus]|uniref:Uncharacterized protein n=1 Tax=Coprinellus micaceus TaxID=71717 RepID=A0A4Y7SFR8_COPMI|nr:hypothetical protein FA13DRAFT_297941 [Coprinellus micaceus]
MAYCPRQPPPPQWRTPPRRSSVLSPAFSRAKFPSPTLDIPPPSDYSPKPSTTPSSRSSTPQVHCDVCTHSPTPIQAYRIPVYPSVRPSSTPAGREPARACREVQGSGPPTCSGLPVST